MRRSELERLRDGLPQGVMAVTPPGRAGALHRQVAGAGDYVVVVDNRGQPSRHGASARPARFRAAQGPP